MTREERESLRATSPAYDGLARLGHALDGVIRDVEMLHGGISASVHGFTLESPGGPRRLVLKRYISSDPVPQREWDGLIAASAADVPTPEPVAFDPSGEWFGLPAMVMSRLPGDANDQPRDAAILCSELARVIAAVHATPLPANPSPALLRPRDWARWRPAPGERDARLLRMAEVLQAFAPMAERLPHVFSHGDYHSQNVLWAGDRATGIIDWPSAWITPRGWDVANCRVALVLCPGGDAPDAFLQHYRDLTGEPLPEMPYWDVTAGLYAITEGTEWATALQHLAPGMTGTDIVRLGAEFVDESFARL